MLTNETNSDQQQPQEEETNQIFKRRLIIDVETMNRDHHGDGSGGANPDEDDPTTTGPLGEDSNVVEHKMANQQQQQQQYMHHNQQQQAFDAGNEYSELNAAAAVAMLNHQHQQRQQHDDISLSFANLNLSVTREPSSVTSSSSMASGPEKAFWQQCQHLDSTVGADEFGLPGPFPSATEQSVMQKMHQQQQQQPQQVYLQSSLKLSSSGMNCMSGSSPTTASSPQSSSSNRSGLVVYPNANNTNPSSNNNSPVMKSSSNWPRSPSQQQPPTAAQVQTSLHSNGLPASSSSWSPNAFATTSNPFAGAPGCLTSSNNNGNNSNYNNSSCSSPAATTGNAWSTAAMPMMYNNQQQTKRNTPMMAGSPNQMGKKSYFENQLVNTSAAIAADSQKYRRNNNAAMMKNYPGGSPLPSGQSVFGAHHGQVSPSQPNQVHQHAHSHVPHHQHHHHHHHHHHHELGSAGSDNTSSSSDSATLRENGGLFFSQQHHHQQHPPAPAPVSAMAASEKNFLAGMESSHQSSPTLDSFRLASLEHQQQLCDVFRPSSNHHHQHHAHHQQQLPEGSKNLQPPYSAAAAAAGYQQYQTPPPPGMQDDKKHLKGRLNRRRGKSPFFTGTDTESLFNEFPMSNNDPNERYSRKVFVGGLPPDIDEEEITASFRRFGPLVVDWPHKAESKSYFPPKGYAFLLFQDESSVQMLIDSCIQEEDKLYLCVSSPTMKDKPVQIRPWRLSDADYVLDASMPLDPRKTVFVGGVPRPLKAVELAMIMDRLYGGVCYAGIDTDPELKYPKGAGRVAFSNQQSYIAAISARFVQLQHADIEKRVEVKPYVLDDQICDECQGARCNGKYAPYFCANITCLQYYCENCWATIHSRPGREFHKPLVKEGADRPRAIPFRWC